MSKIFEKMTTETPALNLYKFRNSFSDNFGNRPRDHVYMSAEEYFADQMKKTQTDRPIIINMAKETGRVVRNKAFTTLMTVTFLTYLVVILL